MLTFLLGAVWLATFAGGLKLLDTVFPHTDLHLRIGAPDGAAPQTTPQAAASPSPPPVPDFSFDPTMPALLLPTGPSSSYPESPGAGTSGGTVTSSPPAPVPTQSYSPPPSPVPTTSPTCVPGPGGSGCRIKHHGGA